MENVFGKRIKFTHELSRQKKGVGRTWIRLSINFLYWHLKKEFKKGIIIGVRTLWNGRITYEATDGGNVFVFIPEKSIKAYLVAVDLKANPIYVLPEDCEIIDKTKK